jgi:hypothetical protein
VSLKTRRALIAERDEAYRQRDVLWRRLCEANDTQDALLALLSRVVFYGKDDPSVETEAAEMLAELRGGA